MEHWIEVEDSFLTDQPARYKRRGGKFECIPDPDVEPTQFWLICYDCGYTPKRRIIRRRRYVYTLSGKNSDELTKLLEDFIDRADVVLIETPKKPLEYANSGKQPIALSLADGA